MTIAEFISQVSQEPRFKDLITGHVILPESPEDLYDGPELLSSTMVFALAAGGILRLYRHQAEGIQLVRQGKHVLSTTPTASGKTLTYNIPVFETLLQDPSARALYLFPYKALGQDQFQGIVDLRKAVGLEEPVTAAIFDGDVPKNQRQAIKKAQPNILVTNPDMLHLSLLAYHTGWVEFFRNLRYVILDELHVYRGVMGCHVAHILRRLWRICRSYGAAPQFIASSATIANPVEFARSITGHDFEVVEHSGAYRPPRHFLFVNPVNVPGNTVALEFFRKSIRAGFKTLAFTKSRKTTELMYHWLRGSDPVMAGSVSSYRAGFLPEERREIEQKLFSGELSGVLSTSALEVGIDVGGLDVCLLVGYPGTVTSTMQRAGRVGRGARESLVILVADQNALDQYFVRHPDRLMQANSEAAVVFPDNDMILRSHMLCAAAELPLTRSEVAAWASTAPATVAQLEKEYRLIPMDDEQAWIAQDRQPQFGVSIRSMGESFSVLEGPGRRLIGTVDGGQVLRECHEGAIYLHRAEQYQVEKLDADRRDVLTRHVVVDYYTQTSHSKETEILEIAKSRPVENFITQFGKIKVTETILGYDKIKIASKTKISTHPLELPPIIFDTQGAWIIVEDVIRARIESAKRDFMGSIHATEHALISIFPLLSLCDRSDMAGISVPMHPQLKKAAIFIYDSYPGGMGLILQAFPRLGELLNATLDLITNCPCEDGCPACIYSPKCGSGNKPLDKQGAILLLNLLLNRIPLVMPALEAPTTLPPLTVEEFDEDGEPALNPLDSLRYVVFDLETQRAAQEVGGWKNLHLMRVSVGVAYDSKTGEYRVFREEAMDELIALLREADLVVGFNHEGFDYGVLRAYTTANLRELPSFDIMADLARRLGHRVSLSAVATATLNAGKAGDGLDALRWFQQGRWDELIHYCTEDVRITHEVLQAGVRTGHIAYTGKNGKPKQISVDWRAILLKRLDRPL